MSDCCGESQVVKEQTQEAKDSQVPETHREEKQANVMQDVKTRVKQNPWLFAALILLGYIVFTQFYTIQVAPKSMTNSATSSSGNTSGGASTGVDFTAIRAEVIPQEGVELPIQWGDLGKRMVEAGVIDGDQFRQLFGGNLSDAEEQMLTGVWEDKVVMTEENSRFWLDMLWAFGLGNRNPILENGEMSDEKYGGAANFASTGGWTLAKGNTMDHYSKHDFVILSDAQQQLVEEVSKGIYRPCCGNSTHFPDCNHGMAMLGLLELMAANGATEEEMYDVALSVNSMWFPQTYLDLATYFQEQGQAWSEVDPAVVLGAEYSSAQGYRSTRSKIQSLPKPQQGGGGCGV